jgi:hypothetical protein
MIFNALRLGPSQQQERWEYNTTQQGGPTFFRTLVYYLSYILSFKFSNSRKDRYRVPMELPNILQKSSEMDYSEVKITKKPFSFKIARKESPDSPM